MNKQTIITTLLTLVAMTGLAQKNYQKPCFPPRFVDISKKGIGSICYLLFVTFSRFTQKQRGFACFLTKNYRGVCADTPVIINRTVRDSEERPARHPHTGGSRKGGYDGRQNVDDQVEDCFPCIRVHDVQAVF